MTIRELEKKQVGLAKCIRDAWELRIPIHIIRMYEKESQRIKIAIKTLHEKINRS